MNIQDELAMFFSIVSIILNIIATWLLRGTVISDKKNKNIFLPPEPKKEKGDMYYADGIPYFIVGEGLYNAKLKRN